MLLKLVVTAVGWGGEEWLRLAFEGLEGWWGLAFGGVV